MKIQYETIRTGEDSSFHLMVNPRLNDFFFWHFHPEYELVFIDGADGNRHVGHHMARYRENDLVFIGSNIPHLNFDYGIQTEYEKLVLHIRKDFLGNALTQSPELAGIRQLFSESAHGIVFSKACKQKIGQRVKGLAHLEGLALFIEVLYILAVLAQDEQRQLLHERPFEHFYKQKEQDRLEEIFRFIEQHYQRKITVEEAAAVCRLSYAAFCRYFKKMTRLTFTEFLNHYRINQAKKLLLQDKNVTETCFACGFESLSYFNRTFRKITGINPLAFKQKFLL
ncbi:helix-turn-helix transcriptional regulator [Flavilitoribacter nigricans]|uniref:AraC family transcriptional regulator n=1 Tax=Flavilitoribacter nigricans (strain ATCC 23147 / DSM 23189 / NBRC 102662 / NCIMB 1420 / SS-2) TaxID=1122177 RepID=A0A2D0N6R9_FLAN2|nr:AraC family transcriptional regulator [Flavilitoribacter nigricans]PHN03473.1 AraC family transcriptional regulator [Flavilitoribacter nigricans DSM 23189 = NBRC 102662]